MSGRESYDEDVKVPRLDLRKRNVTGDTLHILALGFTTPGLYDSFVQRLPLVLDMLLSRRAHVYGAVRVNSDIVDEIQRQDVNKSPRRSTSTATSTAMLTTMMTTLNVQTFSRLTSPT